MGKEGEEEEEAPGARIEIPLVWQVEPPHLIEVHSGVDTHLQSTEETLPGQVGT